MPGAAEAAQGVYPGARARRSTLATRLLLVLAIGTVVPVVGVSLWLMFRTRATLDDAGYVDVRIEAASTARALERSVLERRALLTALGSGDAYLLALVNAHYTCDPLSCEESADSLASYLRGRAAGVEPELELSVLLPDGRRVSSLRPPREMPGPDDSEPDAAEPGPGDGEPDQVEPEQPGDEPEPAPAPPDELVGLCELSGEGLIARAQRTEEGTALVLPVLLREGDQKVGVLCGRFAGPFLPPAGLEEAGVERYVLAGDEVLDGAVGEGQGALATLADQLSFELPSSRQRPWYGRQPSSFHGQVAVAIEPLADLGWAVVAVAPADVAFAPVWSATVEILVALAVLVALLVAVAFMLSRITARPFSRLAFVANQAMRGKLGDTVPVRGPAEAVDAATAFVKLRTELTEAKTNVEDRLEKATRTLREELSEANAMLDAVGQLMLVVRRDGTIELANKAARRVYGDTVVGRRYDEAVEPATNRKSCVWSTLKEGTPAAMERRQRIGVVDEIVRVETYPIFHEEGGVRAAVELARVVSEDKRREEQRAHRQQMFAIGLFAAGMAADLQMPVTNIAAQLKMTREGGSDPDRMRRTLITVERESQRTSALLSDLVIFARRRRHELGEVDVNGVVGDVVRLLRYDPRGRKVTIDTELTLGLPAIRTREESLVQVLLSLGTNAFEAMPGGGPLVFETQMDGGRVVIRVRDGGPGIPAAVREKIFQPFVTTKRDGSGLGLFVSRGLIESLGGELRLERTGGGQTTFRITLPVG